MTKVWPDQTLKPLPTPLAMSTAPADPADPADPAFSPIPIRGKENSSSSDTPTVTRPRPKPDLPKPKVRLEIRDLTHPGARVFLDNVDVASILNDAVSTVLRTLYPQHSEKELIPPVRSVTLVLRSMETLAYTTGTELDDDHKEIHFSLDYISKIASDPPHRQRDEITGVLLHEMVHVWQYWGSGTAPMGLTEGVADYVRLKADLSPPHWKRDTSVSWDAGYQHTAYFLDWLEKQYRLGTVSRINEHLRREEYEEEAFWKELFGKSVGTLWELYKFSQGEDWKGDGVKDDDVEDDDVKGDVDDA